MTVHHVKTMVKLHVGMVHVLIQQVIVLMSLRLRLHQTFVLKVQNFMDILL